ncbi:MAG: DDE-type integrase/transposase/recombinase, partial [Chloroflexi bacterium]|nr:DDE-type integrase/transposase/recombinase [Chloroflexota bacterium]
KVGGQWRYLYRAIDRAGNLLDSMLSERRDKHAARRFLRRLLDTAGEKPLRMTTDKHPAYTKAIRWIVGRKVLHRQNQYLNNRMEQSHRPIKQRYYPMRFCQDSAPRQNTSSLTSRGEFHVLPTPPVYV